MEAHADSAYTQPLFYNVCISLRNMSGPVISDLASRQPSADTPQQPRRSTTSRSSTTSVNSTTRTERSSSAESCDGLPVLVRPECRGTKVLDDGNIGFGSSTSLESCSESLECSCGQRIVVRSATPVVFNPSVKPDCRRACSPPSGSKTNVVHSTPAETPLRRMGTTKPPPKPFFRTLITVTDQDSEPEEDTGEQEQQNRNYPEEEEEEGEKKEEQTSSKSRRGGRRGRDPALRKRYSTILSLGSSPYEEPAVASICTHADGAATEPKDTVSPLPRFLSTSSPPDLGSLSLNGDMGEDMSSLLRKVSHTSDYSLSSRSSTSSSSSTTSSPRTSDVYVHFARSTSQDSDYFGSSSEDEEEEAEEEEEENDDDEEEEDEEDIRRHIYSVVQKSTVTLPTFSRRRQRHSNLKEYDLEQRIALEIKMREGSSKLLAACGTRNLPQTLEAAKNLLTSNERMTAYMAELQRRRHSGEPTAESVQPSQARVCLSDMRMPLIWKDSDHFKNKGDYRRFAVFVLLKIGTEIYDTVMVNPVDRSLTDICFDDIIVFNNIRSDFECNLEVYSHVLQNDLSMASTPRKLKRSLHSSISRTVGRKLAATLKDELSTGDMGPKFDLVASAKLNLSNVSNNIATYDLTLENTENRQGQLPLFGHFCCRLAAQPDCATQERIAGHCSVKESEFPRPWVRLHGWSLEIWEKKEDAHLSPHHPQALIIDRHTEVVSQNCTVQVSNTQGYDRGTLTLTFETIEEAKLWHRTLTQHCNDHRRWGPAAEEEMEILTPQPTRHNFMIARRGRFGSLYEETPLRDGSPSSEKSSYDDLYNTSAFVSSYCTPGQPLSRNRAFTLSSRSSFRRWGSVRCNMPFFKNKV